MKPKKDGVPTNISVRGVTPRAFEVRSGIKIVQGRAFTPGLYEVIVGDKIARRVQGLDLGSSVRLQKHEWKVVGVFTSQGGAFESEIWGDADVMAADFGRSGGANAMSVRLRAGADVASLDRWIRSNPQMLLQAASERKYYDDQPGPLAKVLRQLATFVVVGRIGGLVPALRPSRRPITCALREPCSRRCSPPPSRNEKARGGRPGRMRIRLGGGLLGEIAASARVAVLVLVLVGDVVALVARGRTHAPAGAHVAAGAHAPARARADVAARGPAARRRVPVAAGRAGAATGGPDVSARRAGGSAGGADAAAGRVAIAALLVEVP